MKRSNKVLSLFLTITMLALLLPCAVVRAYDTEYQTLSAGGCHIAAIKSDGSLWTWGLNGSGQLGDGSTTDKSVPTKIMDDVISVSAGYWHTAAIRSDGSLWTWGENQYGQLGDGSTTNKSVPTKIMDDVISVSAGYWHTAAIRSDGSLWTWGYNSFGQLGDGSFSLSKTIPTKIMDDVISVSAGKNYTVAIKSDGSLWTWGENQYGQLGDGSATEKSVPIPTKIMDDVISVSAGYMHTAAIRSDGSLWTWGENGCGQLGDGSTRNKTTPTRIMDDVISVSLGSDYTAAIKSDGSLWTWGYNSFGQFGDGSTQNKIIPTKIMDDIISVSACRYHTAAIKSDASLWTWGENIVEKRGNGTTTDAYTPQKIMDGVRLPSSVSIQPTTSSTAPPTQAPSTTPPTQAPSTTPPTQAERSIKVYCNAPTLSTALDNIIIVGASVTDEAGNQLSSEDLTFDVENSKILKSIKTTDDGTTRYITFSANDIGTTTIKIKDSITGKTAELPFTVYRSSGNAYTIYNVPNLKSDNANFSNFAGLYIDSFEVEKNRNGSASVSFDVYNQNSSYGAVEIYDADGNIADAEIIDKTSFETSIMDVTGTVVEIAKDVYEGVYNPLSYKSSIQSSKTEIRDITIPVGGYMTISVDAYNSPICGIVNQVDLITQTGSILKSNAETVFNIKKVTKTVKEALKEYGKDLIKDYTKGFVDGMSHKTITSKSSLKDYTSKLSELYSSGYLKELAVSMVTSSVSGVAESAVMELFKTAGDPATTALDGFWTFSKANNLLYQAIQSTDRMGSGKITIHVPNGDVRVCSDVTVKCKMNDNTAVDATRLDNNSPILLAVKKVNSMLFGNSEIIGYDISLVEDGAAVQPSGTAEVSIKIPEQLQSGKNISVYYADDSGNITNMNGSVSGDTITFEAKHFSTYIVTADDVETEAPKTEEGQTVITGNTVVSDWAAEEVKEAFDENLVPEVLKGEDLTKQVDRAEFAAIAVNLYEKLSGNSAVAAENPFGDISGNYCEADILKAYNLNITNGVTDITFDPNALISREQVATMLCRAYKKSEFSNWSLASDSSFPLNFMGVEKFADDSEISDYAKESVYFMVRWDIINGVGNNMFAPKNTASLGDAYGYATREQAVVIALRSAKHL